MNIILSKLLDWAANRILGYALSKTESPGPNEVKPTVIEIVRLRPDVLEALERSLPAPYVGPTTTDLMAGHALGVAAVLHKLRTGYATH